MDFLEQTNLENNKKSLNINVIDLMKSKNKKLTRLLHLNWKLEQISIYNKLLIKASSGFLFCYKPTVLTSNKTQF